MDEKEGESGMGGRESVARILVSFKFFENPEIFGVKEMCGDRDRAYQQFVAKHGQ